MKKNKLKLWQKLGGVAGFIAILALVVALIQLWQSKTDSASQDAIQSTQIVLLQEQLSIQQEIATLQANSSGFGPTATVITQRILQLESTRVALATKEANVKLIPINDLTIEVRANIEWVNTKIIIDEGDTVDIKYVTGLWRGVKDGYWKNGTVCTPPQPGSIVPSADGNALIAKIGIDSTPRCVGNSPFVSSNSGILYLSHNDCPRGCFADNEGSVTFHIQVFK